MKLPLFGLCLSGALLSGGIALAHHGWGSYDAGRVMTITGNIEQADWENPHVTLVVPHQGKSWDAVLQDMLAPVGMKAVISGKQVVIQNAA